VTYQVRWTRPASIALEQIQDFIAQENPEAATLVIKDIFHTVERLKDHPKSGRKGRVRGTYELILSGLPYIVPYQVKQREIQILSVYHSARKWPDILG